MFEKYNHKGSWDESLHIFLYHKLIISNITVSALSIEDYKTFELKDTLITSYNEWVGLSNSNKQLLEDWISVNEKSVNHFRENFTTTFKPKVELWSDRKKTTYYKEKLQASFEFENYIAELLQRDFNLDLQQFLTPEGQYDLGENELGIEIKNDTLIKKWGNVYIEYAEKSNSGNYVFVKSGILKDDNSIYFLIGDRDGFWIFRKERLLEIYREEVAIVKSGQVSKRGIKFKQIATSKGFVYPVKNAVADTITIEQMVEEIKDK
jgi:hypothetical protein